MAKKIRKRRLVGRFFLTVELSSDGAESDACTHLVTVQNTTTIVSDLKVFSRVLDGSLEQTSSSNERDFEYSFDGLFERPLTRSRKVYYSPTETGEVRVHTEKVSSCGDVSTSWSESLVDPIIEVFGRR